MGRPVEGAYVRVAGRSGDFVSERRTLEDGAFRFNLVGGSWTLRWLAPGTLAREQVVDLADGQVLDLELKIG